MAIPVRRFFFARASAPARTAAPAPLSLSKLADLKDECRLIYREITAQEKQLSMRNPKMNPAFLRASLGAPFGDCEDRDVIRNLPKHPPYSINLFQMGNAN